MRRLKTIYRSMTREFLGARGYEVPERYQSAFVAWGGAAETQYVVAHLLRDLAPASRVLVIGVMGGRDYFLLKNLGHDVVAVDLGPQPDIEPLIVANVEEALPFEDAEFDAVVLCEVLEHLREDAAALANISRVLKADGQLLVSVPYYHDREPAHLRVHSPLSIQRLLTSCGYAIREYVERPGVPLTRVTKMAPHVISLIQYAATGQPAYGWLNRVIGRSTLAAGKATWLRGVRRHMGAWGAYILCTKGEQRDHIVENRDAYTAHADDQDQD